MLRGRSITCISFSHSEDSKYLAGALLCVCVCVFALYEWCVFKDLSAEELDNKRGRGGGNKKRLVLLGLTYVSYLQVAYLMSYRAV